MTYYECVLISLVIQHAMRMRYIVIYGLSSCKIFFDIVSRMARFSRRCEDVEHKLCVLNFCPTSVGNISHSKKN
jgi:hypothetical protein